MSQATIQDAQLMIQLYDLRREEVMRKARNFIAIEFSPKSADDVMKIATAFGTQENAYFRQVTSYLEMVASLVNRGVTNPELFFDWNGEMIFLFAKFKPFLPELREKLNPGFFGNVEKAIQSHPEAQRKLAAAEQRIAALRARAEAAAK